MASRHRMSSEGERSEGGGTAPLRVAMRGAWCDEVLLLGTCELAAWMAFNLFG